MAKDGRDAPFGVSLDDQLSATLRTVYSRVITELASEIPADRRTAVEAEVAAALVRLLTPASATPSSCAGMRCSKRARPPLRLREARALM